LRLLEPKFLGSPYFRWLGFLGSPRFVKFTTNEPQKREDLTGDHRKAGKGQVEISRLLMSISTVISIPFLYLSVTVNQALSKLPFWPNSMSKKDGGN
jgi:hypothetical protein